MEKASHKANAQCAEDIGKAINSHFDGFHYHTGFEKELIEIYGMERVKYVVAYNIQQKLTMEGSAKRIRHGHCRAK